MRAETLFDLTTYEYSQYLYVFGVQYIFVEYNEWMSEWMNHLIHVDEQEWPVVHEYHTIQ